MSHETKPYGSKNALQLLSNDHPAVFAKAIASHNVRWISPIKDSNYKEYCDNFPELGVTSKSLREFWPKGGPHWDGIAIDETNGEYLLIEAKAHISEIFYTDSRAKGSSTQRIAKRLQNLSKDLNAKHYIKELWQGSLYQTANRLAYLDFLNKNSATKWRNKVKLVYLIFLDNSIADKRAFSNARETKDAWLTALSIAERQMLFLRGNHKLKKHIKHVFISCQDL